MAATQSTASTFACFFLAAFICFHLVAGTDDHLDLDARRVQRIRARRSSHAWEEMRDGALPSQAARDSHRSSEMEERDDDEEEEDRDRDEKDLFAAAAAKRKSSFRGDLGKRSKKSKGFRGDLGKRQGSSSGFRSDLGAQAKKAWYEEGYLSA